MGLISTDWEQLLLAFMHVAFMHDPVDEALGVKERENQAARYASTALGRLVGPQEMKSAAVVFANLAAVFAERRPAPENGVPEARRPMGRQAVRTDYQTIDQDRINRMIAEIVDGLEDPKKRFLALWRQLPGCLDGVFSESISGHSRINHADIISGLWASRWRDAHGGAYLSFALGPVQPFIEAARSVRDLWTGSAILSWLAFQAMLPIIENLGPTALLYPSLRGSPLLDLWLRTKAEVGCIPLPEADSRKSPSLPHRFVAIVPWGQEGEAANRLAGQSEEAVRRAWADLAGKVHEKLKPTFDESHPAWDRLWRGQIEDFFDIATTVVSERLLDDEKMARLTGGHAAEQTLPDATGRWRARMEFSTRVMEANRAVHHVPAPHCARDDKGRAPPKCSLFGSWEQMGPADLNESAQFWQRASKNLNMNGVRLRDGERFCAVALAKRFAGPAVLAGALELQHRHLRFPDTATVAAADWLQKAGINPLGHETWNGRWLHDHDVKPDDTEATPELRRAIELARQRLDRPPPSYYAILKMDGDNVGDWLRGEKFPKSGDEAPPTSEIEAPRPVGPVLQAAISAALGKFATCDAPGIIPKHHGTMIYCGGDDLLALLPASCAAVCADELQKAYSGAGWPGTGERATMSAGIAYVHYMEDLRSALRAARDAEGEAKKCGKDAVHFHFMRRSGEHAKALLPWPRTGWFTELTELFGKGASNRWAYKLRAELPVLPDEAVTAEIRRLGNRIDDQLWNDHAGLHTPGALIAGWWEDYWKACSNTGADRGIADRDALGAFVTLCQGAAFVARGRDD